MPKECRRRSTYRGPRPGPAQQESSGATAPLHL